jgi:hypothetical protein
MRWTKLNLTCIYFKKIKLTYHYFKCLLFICSNWIDRCHLSFCRCHHATALCHTFFPWSQHDLAAFASSSSNTSSHRVPSRAEIEALNPYHYRWPPSLDHTTPTRHCYKKVISALITLSTTQPGLYFTSSLPRTPYTIGGPPVAIIPFTGVPYSPFLHIMTPTVMN